MTREEILSYLDREDISKSNDERLTRLYFGRNEAIVNLLKKDQKAELIEENKWIIYTLDNLNDPITINGDLITNLKSGRLDAL